MSVHGGDILFDAKLNTKPLNKSLSGMEASTSKIANKISGKFGRTLSTGMEAAGKAGISSFAVGVAGGLAVVGAAAVAATLKISELGDEIDKSSQKLGMSTHAYQEWAFILERCGSDISKMQAAMKKLATAAYTNNEAFAKLGITQEELRTLNQEQLFARTIQALQGVQNTTERTYLASQLLGRSATDLGALLNMSAQETDGLRARFQYLGGEMSQSTVKSCAALQDSLTDLRTSLRGVGYVLAQYLAPILTAVINNIMIPLIVGLTRVLQALGAAVDSFLMQFKWYRKIKEEIASKPAQKQFANTADTVNDVATSIDNTGTSAKKSKKQVQELKRELVGFDKINKLTGENKLSSYDAGVSGGTGVAGIKNATQALQDFYDVQQDAGGGGDEDKESWWEKVWGNFKEAHPKIASALETVWETYKKALKKYLELTILGYIKYLENLWKYSKEFATKFVKGLVNFFKDVWEKAKELPDKIKKKWEDLRKGFNNLIDKAKKDVTNKTEKLKAWWDKQQFKAKELKATIKDKATEGLKKIKGKWDGFKETTKSLTVKAIDKVSAVIKRVMELYDQLKEKLKNLSFSIFAHQKTTGETQQTPKRGGLDAILGNIVDNLLGVGHYATGGVFKRNAPTLAVVGDNRREGEIVAPDSKLQAMADRASGAGNAEVIALLKAILEKDTNVYLDGEMIKNNTVKRLNAHTRATGQPELIF